MDSLYNTSTFSTCLVILSMFLLTPIINAQVHHFIIPIDGVQANAGNGTGSTGLGYGIANYDQTTKVLTIEGDFYGMIGTSTVAQVHNNVAGSNGSVLFGLTLNNGLTSGVFSGSHVLTSAEEVDLLADGMYVNIHSTTTTNGEIRGQILRAATFSIFLDEAQTNAGTGSGSTGSGLGTAFYLFNTMEITIQGDFKDLVGTVKFVHMHRSVAGANGPVVFGLTIPTNVMSGVFSGSHILAPDEVADLFIDGMYVNVHGFTNGGSEIRGQIVLDHHCMEDLVINQNPIVSKTYYGKNNHSQGTVAESSDVVFQAEQSINLQAGFEVKIGAEFEAVIGTCP